MARNRPEFWVNVALVITILNFESSFIFVLFVTLCEADIIFFST